MKQENSLNKKGTKLPLLKCDFPTCKKLFFEDMAFSSKLYKTLPIVICPLHRSNIQKGEMNDRMYEEAS